MRDITSIVRGRQSLADRVQRQLRLEIVECRLAPAARLTEAEVAERLGVGKMPAREALQRLVLEGLVRVVPRHGYSVAPIVLDDVRELFDLRLILETSAVERAAGRITRAEAVRLKRLSRVGYQVGEAASRRAYLRANTELHTRIAQLSGNQRLAELVGHVLLESERMINFILPAHPQSAATVREHQHLLNALVAGDAPRARRIATDHIRATRQMVLEALVADARFGDTLVRLTQRATV